MTHFQPDHNGECVHCDEWADSHGPNEECPTDPGQAVANEERKGAAMRTTTIDVRIELRGDASASRLREAALSELHTMLKLHTRVPFAVTEDHQSVYVVSVALLPEDACSPRKSNRVITAPIGKVATSVARQPHCVKNASQLRQ